MGLGDFVLGDLDHPEDEEDGCDRGCEGDAEDEEGLVPTSGLLAWLHSTSSGRTGERNVRGLAAP